MENETNIYDIFRRLEQTANLADSAGYLDLAVAIDGVSEQYADLLRSEDDAAHDDDVTLCANPTCTKLHLV